MVWFCLFEKPKKNYDNTNMTKMGPPVRLGSNVVDCFVSVLFHANL